MLCALHIENIAIITTLDMEFSQGLHVLTGETGAGKSIIIDAINMLLGARGGKNLIRYGEDYALCQGLFSMNDILSQWLTDHDLPKEEELVLTRVIHKDGKNICRINNRLVPSSLLRELAPHLINIHGQHDNQALLTVTKHLSFLDNFCRESVAPLLAVYQTEYEKLKAIRKEMKAISMGEQEKQFRVHMLTEQVKELKKAAPNAENYQIIKEKLSVMENFERLSSQLSESYQALYAGDQSSIDMLDASLNAMAPIASQNATYQDLFSRLTNAKYELSDIAENLASLKDSLSYDPQTLLKWQEYIRTLDTLQKKYNTDVLGLQNLLNQSRLDLENITLSSEKMQELKQQFEQQKSVVTKAAAQLSACRREQAKLLSRRIEEELHDLNMPQAKFEISLQHSDKLLESGIDEVEFTIATNNGMPLSPLSKIASGGELSRVMLAMKAVLAKTEDVGTLIFDEIDTGVSGSAGQKIAEKLAVIAQNKQVLCITHLAQIAAMADTHFFIEKHAQNNQTIVKVSPIQGEERLQELSRIMSGLSSQSATEHSQILLEHARCFKESLS